MIIFHEAFLSPLYSSSAESGKKISSLIEVKDDLVSMHLENADISGVLKELSRKSGFDLTIDKNLSEKVSINLTNVPIEEAIRKICSNRALVFKYDAREKKYQITRIGVFPGSGKDNENLKGSSTQHDYDTLMEKHENIHSTDKDQNFHAAGTSPGEEKKYDNRGRPLYREGELLVKFREGITIDQRTDLHNTVGSHIIKKMKTPGLERIRLRPGLSESEAISLYYKSGIVEVAERHAIRYKNGVIPNDELFNDQWGLTSINAPDAWNITTGKRNIVVAVIDTGVDYTHPDLAGNIFINSAEFNGVAGVDDDNNGYVDDIRGWDFGGAVEGVADGNSNPMDEDGHGTHVAGIIAAEGNNHIGVSGVAWHLGIMPLKVQADNIDPYTGGMDDADIMDAFDYALHNNVQVINCSFGGSASSVLEREMFVKLRDKGIIAVCASGNDGDNLDAPNVTNNYPSSYDVDNIIAVASSNATDQMDGFSNYGIVSVDVMAPGSDIKSTISFSTEASIKTGVVPNVITFPATGMTYAGLTPDEGLSGIAVFCGRGVEPEDFPVQVEGNIALIQRDGKVTFAVKTSNAQAAGAKGVIISNHISRSGTGGGTFIGTLGPPLTVDGWVPVVAVSKEDGAALENLSSPPVTFFNTPNKSASYGIMQGTSMATPVVTGIAGLLLSLNPAFTYQHVKSAICDSVDKIPSVEQKLVSGGRVNVFNALSYAYEYIKGDLNCDGFIGIDDAIISLKVISGSSNFPVCPLYIEWESSHENISNNIGLKETSFILQMASGLKTGQ